MTREDKKEYNRRYYMEHQAQRREGDRLYYRQHKEKMLLKMREIREKAAEKKERSESATLGIDYETWHLLPAKTRAAAKLCASKYGISPAGYLLLTALERKHLNTNSSRDTDRARENIRLIQQAAEHRLAEKEKQNREEQKLIERKKLHEQRLEENRRARAEWAERKRLEQERKAEARREYWKKVVAARDESRTQHRRFLIQQMDVLTDFKEFNDPQGKHHISILTPDEDQEIFRSSDLKKIKAVYNRMLEHQYFVRIFLGRRMLLIHEADKLFGLSCLARQKLEKLIEEEERK